ncbi:hypothetical protein HaLaN_26267 [Haematococcus lacustris]|uniref:Uncharacterized protein n=1 Tax=Haematococcus lacustris TaxID=44745 RepID=A0A6A0A5U3_HAELA|nr:hypothetical protein HaLaN_26267 [Haematococcus lacustris]
MFSTPSVPGSWLGLLRLQVQGSVVTLQPRRSPGDKAPSLVLDLKTGRVTQQQGGTRVPDTAPLVHGVVGVMVLGSGAVLALVTSVPDAVFHVEEIQLITHEAVKSNTGDLK